MEKMVICIGRQYGSGGREIGEAVAKKLGIACYDKCLIQKAAREAGLSESAVAEYDERGEELECSEETFAKFLYTSDIPDPELLIRTSGEMRISNFLLWQIAYSEFVVTDVLWPDFDCYEFLRALLQYQGRDRRFGGVK